MKGIQNVNNIIPNLHELNLQQQDINKLNELFKATNLSSHPTSTSKQPMLQSTQLSKIRNQHSYQSTLKNSIQTSLFNLFTVNQAQTSRQKYKIPLYSISSSKGCRKMQQLALQCKEKSQKMRENSLQSQINFLKQQSQTLQKHISTINRKYSQKRQQANTYMLKYLQQKDNNQELLNKYNRLQKQLKDQRVRITNAFNDRLCVQKQEFIAKQSQYHLKIGKLENDIGKLTQLLTFTQKQYFKIKELLSIETNKRTIKQQQFSNSHNQFNQSINALKEQLSKTQKQLYKKQKELFQKEQYISSIQKSFKQLNKRLLYTEQLNRKQLMKEKAIAKRAIDGLQMTRKYSQLELNKSRKKQKDYINKEKELISIIKQISKNRNNTEQQPQKQKQKQKVDKSISDTADISYRKSEIKSLNTTLKIRKDERQTMTPFISNFQIQDTSQQHINQLSPINAIRRQQDLTFKKQNQLKYNRSTSKLQLKGNNPQCKDQNNIKSKQNKNRNKNANTNMNVSQQSSLKNSTISVNINLDVFTNAHPYENDIRNKKKDIKVQLEQDRDITIGTPCFQVHNNDKLFKAIKRY